MAPEQQPRGGQETAKPGSGSPLRIIIPVAVLVLLLIAGSVIAVRFGTGEEPTQDELQALTVSGKVGDFWPDASKKEKGLVVAGNLHGQDAAIHFSATIQLELAYYPQSNLRRQALEEIGALEAWVADVCRQKLASRTESQIHNEAEQQRIKQEIIQRLNQRLEVAKVRDVCFRELLTQ